MPSAQLAAQVVPPQSGPVSLPFLSPSVQLAAQSTPVHLPPMQSPLTAQPWLNA